mmetsp:Transcript_67574/g.187390  ORF Transcript_67574/g.187390 Transcript_67574/m.187390 type:complete len:121 (-) Transcript_67574:130-492(-)
MRWSRVPHMTTEWKIGPSRHRNLPAIGALPTWQRSGRGPASLTFELCLMQDFGQCMVGWYAMRIRLLKDLLYYCDGFSSRGVRVQKLHAGSSRMREAVCCHSCGGVHRAFPGTLCWPLPA